MDPTFHEIDPNGDTLLILRNANAPFATMGSDIPWPNALPDYWTGIMKENESQLGIPAPEHKGDSEPEIRMKLSSKHLMLASSYFEKMMSNKWKETNTEDGYAYSVSAEEWDKEAFLILMNIIHGRTTKVPREVSVEMLAKIAVLIDYYKCHETADFFAKSWMASLPEPLPSSYGRHLLLRLFISCVFSDAYAFQELTKTIISQSRGPIHSLGLPIPETVINALDTRRQDLISAVLANLNFLKAQFYKNQGVCSFECASFLLGALMKGMNAIGLLDPEPRPPFTGYSFGAMEEAIRDIRKPSKNSCRGLSNCNLSAKIRPILDAQLRELVGLYLNNYITQD